MRKGMTGEAVRNVFLLVMLFIVLVVLWLFFSGQLKFSALLLEDITKGVRTWLCKILPTVAEFAFCTI